MSESLFAESDPAPFALDPEDSGDRERFAGTVWEYYRNAGRVMPWRSLPTEYNVFVSEYMLQQTQVSRVMKKFPIFVERYPTFEALAGSALSDVLADWSGLGYNRRAKFMRESARRIVDEFGGRLPRSPETLRSLPGIGVNTAGSLTAFAHNTPAVFIETNIRRVYLHFFFPGRREVHDQVIVPIIERTLDVGNPREWYWALMDYGVALSRSVGNANRRSAHYSRQSPFQNSDRQLRGRLLKLLTEHDALSAKELPELTGFSAERVARGLAGLEREGMVRHQHGDNRWVIED